MLQGVLNKLKPEKCTTSLISLQWAYAIYSLIFILFFGITAFRSHESGDLARPLINKNASTKTVDFLPLCDSTSIATPPQIDAASLLRRDSSVLSNKISSPYRQTFFTTTPLPVSSSTRFLLRFNGHDNIIDLRNGNVNSAPKKHQLKESNVTPVECDCEKDNIGPILNLKKEIFLPCGSSYEPSSIGIPAAIDDCDYVTLTYQDFDLDDQSSERTERVIKRTWHALDGCNNKTSADQLIYFTDCDVGHNNNYIYSHFDSRYYPSRKRTWRDSGYYFIPELVDFKIGLVKETPTGTVGMKVTFSGSDVSGLRYRGNALFFIESPLSNGLNLERGNIGSASLLISEDLLLCPSPSQEIGLGQDDPYFPLQLSGELLSIQGESLPDKIPMRIQLNDFTVR